MDVLESSHSKAPCFQIDVRCHLIAASLNRTITDKLIGKMFGAVPRLFPRSRDGIAAFFCIKCHYKSALLYRLGSSLQQLVDIKRPICDSSPKTTILLLELIRRQNRSAVALGWP